MGHKNALRPVPRGRGVSHAVHEIMRDGRASLANDNCDHRTRLTILNTDISDRLEYLRNDVVNLCSVRCADHGFSRRLSHTAVSQPPNQQTSEPSLKRKRPRSFLNMALDYVGNDLLSHTLSRAVHSAPAGLKLRRLAGVTLSAVEGEARSRNPEQSRAITENSPYSGWGRLASDGNPITT